MTKRKTYSEEFRACAVARVLDDGAKPTAVARDLGISVGQLKTWRLEQQAAGFAEAVARQKAEAAELKRLRQENKRLEEENEILRKASSFFAQWAGKQ
ncbi:transposase [Terasakiella pusilla]|uniref:transposase n=1 Tax=Terasakiella pusilla TaxID=64973 RepID=UPI00048D9614|nr:transposase [Terasakiella pusilla]